MRSNWRQLISLLLLSSLLIHEAQGIRLIKGNPPANKQHKIQNDENKPKPVGSPTSGKTTKKEEDMSVNPSSTTSVTDQRQPEMYPDIVDIAGMDYSQARRKPPIHN